MAKQSIHNSGPLGMLIKSGQIKKVDIDDDAPIIDDLLNRKKVSGASSYFKTQFGLEFSENELVYIDPKECEPWEYANRHQEEMGAMDELIESVRLNTQLQPALVRKHANPHGAFKYEVVFGRRRHAACLSLGIPLWVICKNIESIGDAIAFQDAENKLRDNISNYSNAMLYGRLLKDEIFDSEVALATKLNISPSTLNDLMCYTKIPEDIVKEVPDIHALSKNIAIKIVTLLRKSKAHHEYLKDLAGRIGKSITSPAKLEAALNKKKNNLEIDLSALKVKEIVGVNNKVLFSYKVNHRGNALLAFDKAVTANMDADALCDCIRQFVLKAEG